MRFDGAPCTQTTPREADTEYAVGPVYLAHVQDWRRVSRAWWQMMPKVHDQYPQLLAEMYAMTIATANLTLPWSLVSHFMVSDPKTMSPTEAWSWVEDLTLGADGFSTVCEGANATTLPIATRDRSSVALPTVLHHQRYEATGHVFASGRFLDFSGAVVIRCPSMRWHS